MRRNLLPFIVAATLFLPGCPLTDHYYLGSSGMIEAGGGPDNPLAGSGGTPSAGGSGAVGSDASGSGAVGSGAGANNTSGTEGCVVLTNQAPMQGAQAHDYAFCFTPLTQASARADCVDRGMTLAVIEDRPENDWIARTLSERYKGDSSRAFIGANDVTTEGEWRWADGIVFWSNGAAISGRYTNWSDTEPNDESPIEGAADCLTSYFSDGTWADLSCDAELPYVCEPR